MNSFIAFALKHRLLMLAHLGGRDGRQGHRGWMMHRGFDNDQGPGRGPMGPGRGPQ